MKASFALFLVSKLSSLVNNPNAVTGTMTFAASEGEGAKQEAADLPQLPPSDGNDKDIPSIRLGETIRFEEWGPIILNSDGTTRRIANWDDLTPQEQQVTWRRISKRNEQRRLALLEQQKQQQAQDKEATENGGAAEKEDL